MLGTRTLTAGPIAVMILVRLPDQYPRRKGSGGKVGVVM